jgi:ABC-type sugar transport system ATPase subunit
VTVAVPEETMRAAASETLAQNAVLSARRLVKSYGATEALRDVSIDFRAGEVHALVGENGAGKSTLTRLLAGEEQPDAGEIHVGRKRVPLLRPSDAQRAGIALVHQQFELVDALSVAENICLENPALRRFGGVLPLLDRRAMVGHAERSLAPFDMAHRVTAGLRELSVAERQVVEICRALSRTVLLLILDEPTSALNAAETETLMAHVRRLADQGAAILYITHNLSDALAIADRITVLRDGRLIATAPRHTLDAAKLVQMMVGRDLGKFAKPRTGQTGEAVLETTMAGRSIGLAGGEILGIPSYIGSSVRRFLDRLSGARRGPERQVLLKGLPIGRRSIAARVRQGICFVPGDTAAEGLIPKLSIEDNILLPNVHHFTRFGLIDRAAIRQAVDDLIRSLDIRPADPSVAVERLSGGNRQKVAIAKWLLAGADVLIMDDPTRGVDVGAKAELYRLIAGHAERGGAAVLASSDLDELIALSSRLIVLRGEAVVAELTETPFDRARILAALNGNPASTIQGDTA